MNTGPHTIRKTVQTFTDELTLTLLASLNHVQDAERLPGELRVPAVDAFIDASLGVAQARQTGTGPFAGPGRDWMAPYRAMLTSEGVARQMLDIPAQPSFESGAPPEPEVTPTIAAQLDENRQVLKALAEQVAAVTAAAKPIPGILFSEAAEKYIKKTASAKGDDHPNLGYFRNVAKAFIALCGDRPVNVYGEDELQHFVNECSYLPPNFTKTTPDADYSQVATFIAANRKAQGRGLAEGTLLDSYLGRVRSIIAYGCRVSKASSGITGAKITIPDRAAPRRAPGPVDAGALGKIIAKGVESGILSDALLPALGILTGRRISLLATMRREDIVDLGGVWVVFPESHRLAEDGTWVRVPYKSTDSLQCYVLSPIFERCGFIAWAKQQPGYVFEQLMQAKDPGDAAQKRMARLFRSVGADPRTVGTFHRLRHGKIAHDRAVKLPARLIRAQAGHNLGDVHDSIYGGLTGAELCEMRDAPLPPGIDWDILNKIDFEAFAKKRPVGGRPAGRRNFARPK
ncbi:hypothetical protein ACIKTA_06700 [Hansschlegelia beijingensis]